MVRKYIFAMKSRRKIRLILTIATVLLLFFTSLNVYTSYAKMKRTVEEAIANQSLEAAKSIASDMNVEAYEHFLENPIRNGYYWEIRNYLNDAREKLGALYIYTIEIDNPRVSKAMITGHPKNGDLPDDFPIGEPASVPEEQVRQAYYQGKTFVTGVIEDPKYGTYLSVGAPITNKQNEIIGYLAVDISANQLNDIKGQILKNNMYIFIFNGVFILVVVVTFFFLQRWYLKEVAKEVGYTEDTYLTEIQTLISSVCSFRHDFINHTQVIYGYLKMGASDHALEYVTSMLKEAQMIESIKLHADHPGLAILMQTKKLAAQNHNIDMEIEIAENKFDHINTTDLIKILSNLIDNAIEATIELPEEKREISIDCQADDTHYKFIITNTGPKIEESERIFKKGYSTKKEEPGKIRGHGLFIVKEVLKKYDGEISFTSTNEFVTTAIVEIPVK